MKVRDVIKLVEADGWYLISTEGDHRKYKHPTQRGRVTIAGHPSKEMPPGTLVSVFKQANCRGGNKMYRYLIIIEKGNQNYGAYSPDLPGCVAVGDTVEEVQKNMQEAIAMHLRGMIEDQEPIPTPQTTAKYVDISFSDSAA